MRYSPLHSTQHSATAAPDPPRKIVQFSLDPQSGAQDVAPPEEIRDHATDAREHTAKNDFNEKPVMSEQGLMTTLKSMTHPDRTNKQVHLIGLRGILALESFVWTYFQLFIPTLVSNQTPGPEYQDLLREILSVPLWNLTFVQNFFIILSMRTICLSFLQSPTGRSAGGTVIRRIVRLAITLCIASGMSTLIFSQRNTDFIDDFKSSLPNRLIQAPLLPYNGVAAVNSLFILFWSTKDFASQAANTFWPSQTLWVLSLIYYQSYTVYFLMIILPFTRPSWHLPGLFLFALGSFWYGSWGWYSATGLFLASMTVYEPLRTGLARGIRFKSHQLLPFWVPAIVFAFIGLALKYAFTVRPQHLNALLVLHPFFDLSETTSVSEASTEPYARLDDWFLITGILVLVELFEPVQFFLSFKPLVWLGERSLSLYIMQCITFWTAGVKFWLYLHRDKGIDISGSNTIALITCIVAIALFAEVFYRLVDLPSQWIAKQAYIFLIT